MPSRNLPKVKRPAVTAAPTHTSFQRIFTSGKVLNMSANKAVTTAIEIQKFSACQTTAPPGSECSNTCPTQVSAALTISDTSSKNATPTTNVKEKKRSLTTPQMPRPGFGATSQTVFSAACSSPNTPEAPNSNTTTPITRLNTPVPGVFAFLTIDSMALAAPPPTTPLSSPAMC